MATRKEQKINVLRFNRANILLNRFVVIKYQKNEIAFSFLMALDVIDT